MQMEGIIKYEWIFDFFKNSNDDFINNLDLLTETNYNNINGDFKGKVFKIRHDEKGNRITFIKILQGSLKAKDVIKYVDNEEEKVVDNILLKEVLGKLEKRERQIIMLRYFEDKTQSEIGEILKISQVQVSRIEKKVLLKLKSYIS